MQRSIIYRECIAPQLKFSHTKQFLLLLFLLKAYFSLLIRVLYFYLLLQLYSFLRVPWVFLTLLWEQDLFSFSSSFQFFHFHYYWYLQFHFPPFTLPLILLFTLPFTLFPLWQFFHPWFSPLLSLLIHKDH